MHTVFRRISAKGTSNKKEAHYRASTKIKKKAYALLSAALRQKRGGRHCKQQHSCNNTHGNSRPNSHKRHIIHNNGEKMVGKST